MLRTWRWSALALCFAGVTVAVLAAAVPPRSTGRPARRRSLRSSPASPSRCSQRCSEPGTRGRLPLACAGLAWMSAEWANPAAPGRVGVHRRAVLRRSRVAPAPHGTGTVRARAVDGTRLDRRDPRRSGTRGRDGSSAYGVSGMPGRPARRRRCALFRRRRAGSRRSGGHRARLCRRGVDDPAPARPREVVGSLVASGRPPPGGCRRRGVAGGRRGCRGRADRPARGAVVACTRAGAAWIGGARVGVGGSSGPCSRHGPTRAAIPGRPSRRRSGDGGSRRHAVRLTGHAPRNPG